MNNELIQSRLAAVIQTENQQSDSLAIETSNNRENALVAKGYITKQQEIAEQAQRVLQDVGVMSVKSVFGKIRHYSVETSKPVPLGKIKGVSDPKGRNYSFAVVEVAKLAKKSSEWKWLSKFVIKLTPIETSYFGVRLYAGTEGSEDVNELTEIAKYNSHGVDIYRKALAQGDDGTVGHRSYLRAVQHNTKDVSEIADTLNMIDKARSRSGLTLMQPLDHINSRQSS